MARYNGKNGSITAGGNEIGEVESFDLTISVNELDANVMGNNGWADVEPGLASASGSVAVLHDHADTGQAELNVGATVTLVLYPAGNTTGLQQITGDFLVTERSVSANATELVKATYSIRNKGAVTIGAVA